MSTTTSTGQEAAPKGVGHWLYERFGIKGISYPVPKHANSFSYLLGGISLVGFVILFITGLYMAQFYSPETSEAHNSVIYIITGVPLGDLVRSIHFWTAQIVTATVLLHLLRVLYSGAFKRPREITWYVGLGLLLVTLGAVYTGSVLKYDQEGLEALEHSVEAAKVGGPLGIFLTAEFSRSTSLLTRFFSIHTSVLPLTFALLIGAHIFLIKQHGISPKATPEATTRSTEGEGESRFDLHLRRLAGYGLILLSIVLVLALLLPAQLGQPGVPGTEVSKPWWMFIWLFPAENALGVWALVVVPAILGALLLLVPVLDRSPYLSPLRRKGILITAGVILLLIAIAGIVAAIQPVSQHLME